MAATSPSPGQLFLFILLPIASFLSIAIGLYYCYRRKKCCFEREEEALLGNAEKKRFTVDMGKRKRRHSSLNSNSWGSLDSFYQSKHQDLEHSARTSKGRYHEDSSKRSSSATIIAAGAPRPDIKKTHPVGQALIKENSLLPSSHVTLCRAMSSVQSLSDYSDDSAGLKPSNEHYSRHFSYDLSLTSRKVGENLAYTAIIEKDIPETFTGGVFPPIAPFESVENVGRVQPSPRRLRHQGRVKNNDESFSRPTNQPRVSLVISAVDSIDLESSDESGTEVAKERIHPNQLYSSSIVTTNRKSSNSRGELHPSLNGGSSSSEREIRKSPSTQYGGRSPPSMLEAVDEENSNFVQRSPNIRSRSSPVEHQQTSLDMYALQAALSQHRRSEGEVLECLHRNDDNVADDSQPEGFRREGTVSQSSVPCGRRTGAVNASPHSSTSSLSIGKDSYTGRQGRRRSSMQMPIDLSQINPKLYEDMIKLPSVDSEEPDVEGPQIHFVLDYSKDLEILDVKLIQATNLPTQAFSGTCDPYCTVEIVPGLKARQSKVHRRTTDPEFEEKFAFPIKAEDLRFKTLEIRTFDFDQFSRDECTGVMTMKLDVIDFGLTTHYDLWKKFKLLELRAPESLEICGDLMLALSYLPSAEKLTVAIQKARNLNAPESRKGPPDPYIKVSLFRGTQRLKKKKTDTAQGTYNPVFNQALTFSVSPELLQCPLVKITCQAVHDQKLGANEELGYLEIGPGSKNEEELKHWRDVTGKHPSKPVARWHKLNSPEASPDETKGSFLNLATVRRSSSSVVYSLSDKPDSGRASPAMRRSLS